MANPNCCNCGEPLTDEEMDPLREVEGQPICDQCWKDEYQETCCFCGEYEDVSELGDVFVVSESVDASFGGSVQPGIYRVTVYPFWVSNYFSSRMYSENIERITDVPQKFIAAWNEGAPCGYLCRRCQKKHVPAKTTTA